MVGIFANYPLGLPAKGSIMTCSLIIRTFHFLPAGIIWESNSISHYYLDESITQTYFIRRERILVLQEGNLQKMQHNSRAGH